MSHLDIQYVSMLQHRLDRFQIQSRNPLLVNFRCPFCGDSKKSKTIARGFIISKPNDANEHYYLCHNCGKSYPNFGLFLKEIDPLLWKDYLRDTFMEKKSMNKREVKEEPKRVDWSVNWKRKKETDASVIDVVENEISGLTRVSDLDDFHPAKRYLTERKIPVDRMNDIYWTSEFKKWINTRVPNKFEDTRLDEGRVVLPFRSSNGKLVGVTGRSLDPKTKLRYLAIMFEEGALKAYNLENAKLDSPLFVFEGAFDSMFVKNAVAMAGLGNDHIDHPDKIFVIDNEPRNLEVVKRMKKLIDNGRRVVIWPRTTKSKDLNQMILTGEVDINVVEKFLLTNTHKGINALTKFNLWKRR